MDLSGHLSHYSKDKIPKVFLFFRYFYTGLITKMNTKKLQLFNKKWNYSKLFICPKLKFQPGIFVYRYICVCVCVNPFLMVNGDWD